MSAQASIFDVLDQAHLDRLRNLAYAPGPEWLNADAAEGYLIAMEKLQTIVDEWSAP